MKPPPPEMKSIPVQEAIGRVLCHDVTEIVPGKVKGPRFRKGHVIAADDVDTLLNLGKRFIYVFDPPANYLHENDAAQRIAGAAAGQGIAVSEPVEGKVALSAVDQGLLKINVDVLHRLNMIEDVIFSTLHAFQPVAAGQIVAGTRIIPLIIDQQRIETAEAVLTNSAPLISVNAFKPHRVGMIVTGSEVYSGRIKDQFGPVIRRKFEALGCRIAKATLVSDDIDMTVNAIRGFIDEGLQMIAITGGMSVDPDDQTPTAIRSAGGSVVSYGAPVLPGAMFMLAFIGDIPIVGLPGCVMYYKASIFDLIVPRLLAGETVTRESIVALGHGGLCLGCAECRYPHCAFGKGGI